MYKRKALGEMKSISNLPKQKQKELLEERKEVEKVKHMREKRKKADKLNEMKRKALQKKLKDVMSKYKGLTKMITKTSKPEELKVLDQHKKDLDKEYKQLHSQLQKLPQVALVSPTPPSRPRGRRSFTFDM